MLSALVCERLRSDPSAAERIFCAETDTALEFSGCGAPCVRNVDLVNCSSKQDLLQRLASSLSFPDYFAPNWDSFEECLADLEWFQRGTLTLVLANSGASELGERELSTLFAVLRDVAAEWDREHERRLTVIAIGDCPGVFRKALAKNSLQLEALTLEPHDSRSC